MKPYYWMLCFLPVSAFSQTIERQSIDIIYGNEIIRSEHQVVLSSPEEVSVIPVEQTITKLGPNVVIGVGVSSYLEENAIAKREQEIYEEVNQRTEDSPFTVLFTGHIPEEIQQRRLSLMSDFGALSGQVESPDTVKETEVVDDEGFSPAGKGTLPMRSDAEQKELEKLIGG